MAIYSFLLSICKADRMAIYSFLLITSWLVNETTIFNLQLQCDVFCNVILFEQTILNKPEIREHYNPKIYRVQIVNKVTAYIHLLWKEV